MNGLWTLVSFHNTSSSLHDLVSLCKKIALPLIWNISKTSKDPWHLGAQDVHSITFSFLNWLCKRATFKTLQVENQPFYFLWEDFFHYWNYMGAE